MDDPGELTDVERQTKALEDIAVTVRWLFGLVLCFAVAWLIWAVNFGT